jgi:archaeosortase A (PGF-CTERM-specific)
MVLPALQQLLSAVSPLAIARPLSWVVVVAFLTAGALESRDTDRARTVAVGAWVLFGAFWLALVPHFVFEQKSIVEGLGSIAAVPLSVYAGYLLRDGRDSLFVLSRAIGFMGLLYLPFSYIPLLESNPVRHWMVEVVADQTAFLMSLIGVEPTLIDGLTYNGSPIEGKTHPDESTFVFPGNTRPITYTIILACTGIGSMAIIAGGVLAVSAPMKRKLHALAIALSVIYVLNLIRNAFIATAFGQQRMQWFEGTVMWLFGLSDPQLVSYYIADRLLAQFGSVIAMVIITWLVVQRLPGLLIIVEDLLYLLTAREFDLADAFGVPEESGPVSAD